MCYEECAAVRWSNTGPTSSTCRQSLLGSALPNSTGLRPRQDCEIKTDGETDSCVDALHSRLSHVPGDAVHEGILTRDLCPGRTCPHCRARSAPMWPSRPMSRPHGAMAPGYSKAVLPARSVGGLRGAEASALRVTDVDFDTGMPRPVIQCPHEPLMSDMSRLSIPGAVELEPTDHLLDEDFEPCGTAEHVVIAQGECPLIFPHSGPLPCCRHPIRGAARGVPVARPPTLLCVDAHVRWSGHQDGSSSHGT